MSRGWESPQQRMDRAFRAALYYGQEMRGENEDDAVRLLLVHKRTYRRRLAEPGTFLLDEIRKISRYFDDRQLCEACGVEYHGSTPNSPPEPCMDSLEFCEGYSKALRDIRELISRHDFARERKRNNVKHILAALDCIITDPDKLLRQGPDVDLYFEVEGKKVVYSYEPIQT